MLTDLELMDWIDWSMGSRIPSVSTPLPAMVLVHLPCPEFVFFVYVLTRDADLSLHDCTAVSTLTTELSLQLLTVHPSKGNLEE